MSDSTLNDPGAVLGELNNLRKVVVAAIALLRRERADVREQEFFGPREGAETLDTIANDLEGAYELHLQGRHEEALSAIGVSR